MERIFGISRFGILLLLVIALAGASGSPTAQAEASKIAPNQAAFGLEGLIASQKAAPDQQAGLFEDADAPSLVGNAISFQGQLNQGGAPVNGKCDFQFSLWSSESGPAQVGATQTILNLSVASGLFLADNLDFGASAFPGDPRWIGVAARCPSGTGSYTTLTPRLAVRPAPYALYSGNSDTLDGQHASSFLGLSGGTIYGDLSVNGLTHFYMGGGEISMSTPGGWPGVIMYAPNGHRREITIKNDILQILVSSSSSPSPNESGININESGFVGIGTQSPQARLDVAGTARAKALTLTGGADLAEPFAIAGEVALQKGFVVVIDEQNPGQLRLTDQPYDRKVAGCISGAGGLQPGLVMQAEDRTGEGDFPVTLSGRVYCWADASFGAIQPGDLLTTSPTPGHVMLAADLSQAGGAVLGKAMSALLEGKALVLVLAALQ